MTAKLKLLQDIERWSSVYEFSFQFWGDGNNNVYIEKAGIELWSSGGLNTIEDALKEAMEWVLKQNPSGKVKPEKPVMANSERRYNRNRCAGCGCAIAEGNDYCGECLCEDDSDF